MTAARFHLSREQALTNAGVPAAGAKLFFYTTGTTTPLNTYSNANLATLNANPVVADSNGRFGDIFLQDQTYRVILKDSTEATTFFDTDPVYKDVTFIRSAGLPAVSFPNMLVHNTSDSKKYRRNSAGSDWIDEGPIDSVGNTAGVSDVVAGTSTSLFATPDAVAGLWERGADIASATTLTVPAGGGGYFEVTGTTTIAGINSQRSGLEIELRFTGSLTLTNSASFLLFGGADVAVVAGDIARFRNVSTVGTSGTNWRMVGFSRSLNPPTPATSAKTANYTVAATDRGGLIRFSGLSADVTLSLPAVSGLAGFTVTFANTDGTYAVTVDGNGSETIDGFTTRRHSGPGPITLFCDGSAWYTMAGRWRSVSAAYTIAASTLETYAHGLGVTPASITFICTCINASGGYATGDKLVLSSNLQSIGSGSAMYGWTTQADATNVYLRPTATNFGTVVNQDTFLQSNLSYGDWSVRIVAEA